MPKLTPREKMHAWRGKCLESTAAAAVKLSAILSDAKKLRSELGRTIERIAQSSEKIKDALSPDDRRDKTWEALAKEHGEEVASAMFDEIDTSAEDERDEDTISQIDELSFPDPNDALDQAIDSLEILGGELSELMAGLRGVK